MNRNTLYSFFVLAMIVLSAGMSHSQPTIEPNGGMLRYPDVSKDHIAFIYADDVWIVDKTGGIAQPLASPDGGEMFPRFSPDGQTIAFMGNYDGNSDLYTLPIEGGIPFRVTYHSSAERLQNWTADGRLVFSMGGLGSYRIIQLFTVDADGGMPEKLPVPYGDAASISPTGEWLAYTPHNRDFRTWKRYRGGWASDIWLFHLTEHTSKKITDWEGTDTFPMWQNGSVYYLTDAGPNHRLNIWRYDLESEEHEQITHFREYDVKWPSNGPGSRGEGEIVFESGGQIYLLNLGNKQVEPIEIRIPGAKPNLRPIREDVSGMKMNWAVSPNGKRALVQARGDIWSLPASQGTPRNLTMTSGIAEREPSWSPDGKHIAYISDESGENQLVLHPAHGDGDPETVTSFTLGYYDEFVWSPDSKWIAFMDHEERFHVLNIENKEVTEFDRRNMARWRLGVPGKMSWSPDSKWIAYNRPIENNVDVIFLYHVETGETHQMTHGMFWDGLPTFDRKGDFLYFISTREISNPMLADIGYSSVFNDTIILHALPLRNDVSNPLKPTSDEEAPPVEEEDEDEKPAADDDAEEESAEASDDKSEEAEESEEETIEIDFEDTEMRAFRLPVPRGRIWSLVVNDQNQLIFNHSSREGESKIALFDPYADDPEMETVAEGSLVDITPDGKKLLVSRGGNAYVIDAKAGQSLDDAVVDSPMRVVINPREEWTQIYHDTWRFMRDYFYDPGMHQVDWPAIRDQYEAMLEDCVSRRDLNFVIGEMISEVNAGHTYRGGGDMDSGPSFPIGYMGADFELDQGVYRVTKFYQGGPWDTDARPFTHMLDEAQREAFEYVFAVNDVSINTDKPIWAAFEGYSNQTVTLTVGASPDITEATEVVVRLLTSGQDANLRYRDWVESNRSYVAEQTDGAVGYIHVPNTSDWGERELWRQFYGQMNTQALIIDDRWNGGGNIADRYVELLNRPVLLNLFDRSENDWRIPTVSHQGPKCMLISPESASGGDIFPYLFRQAGVGKLIGMRTWGGVIGISKNPGLIDGGRVTVPFVTFYETDGTLTMEGHGVDPHIEVIADPALMVDGGDPQLDAAIEHMLEEIETNPYVPAPRPGYPDRRGMGITEDDI